MLLNFEMGFNALHTQNELEVKNEQLEESASYRARLLRSITHGLNTPLSTILGYMHLLKIKSKSYIENNTDLNNYFKKLELATKDMEEQVKIYLDMARINRQGLIFNTNKMAVSDFLSPLKSLISTEAKTRLLNLNIEDETDGDKRICTDEARYHFALRTIFKNALRFAPANDKVIMKMAANNGHLEISLEDHGKQIKKNHIPLLGSEFLAPELSSERIHHNNHFAMALAVKLIRLVNGDIHISSNKTRTIHKIQLPMELKIANETKK
jgi:K+-sensing histidine kinase KdpD